MYAPQGFNGALRKSYEPEDLHRKLAILSDATGYPLEHLGAFSDDPRHWEGNIENPIGIIQVPVGLVGPLHVRGRHCDGSYFVPMATTEGAMLLNYDLGAHLLGLAGPIRAEVLSKSIHISPMFLPTPEQGDAVEDFLDAHEADVRAAAEAGSRHTKLLRVERTRVNDNRVLTFVYDTGDAQGLNMINKATYQACELIRERTGVRYYLRSHHSGGKHHALLNERRGYGQKVKAHAVLPARALRRLGVTAPVVKDFVDRCAACGTAAGISRVNVHAANAIAAVFIACGQDVADLSSASTVQTRCELDGDGDDLYIESVLYNLTAGTVGGGTRLAPQRECLALMQCLGPGTVGRFAELVAATVLAGEFPTIAAVITGKHVRAHQRHARGGQGGAEARPPISTRQPVEAGY